MRATKKHENSKPMNTLVLKGDWNIVKGPDDDLRYGKGNMGKGKRRNCRVASKKEPARGWDEVERALEDVADIDALGRPGSKRNNIQWQ